MVSRSAIGRLTDAFKQMSNGSVQMYRCGKHCFAKNEITAILKKDKITSKDGIMVIEKLIARSEFKRDLVRSLPAIALFSLPIVGFWLCLPMVLFYPHKCLGRQFWTPKQRMETYNKTLATRTVHYSEAKESLEELLDISMDPGLKRLCHNIIHKSGELSTQEFDALALALAKPELNKHLFGEDTKFRVPLACCLGVSPSKLSIRATNMVIVDRLILNGSPPRELVEQLPHDLLDIISHHRGITLTEDRADAIKNYLKWLKYTQRYSHLKNARRHLGVVLYAPILLFDGNRSYLTV